MEHQKLLQLSNSVALTNENVHFELFVRPLFEYHFYEPAAKRFNDNNYKRKLSSARIPMFSEGAS